MEYSYSSISTLAFFRLYFWLLDQLLRFIIFWEIDIFNYEGFEHKRLIHVNFSELDRLMDIRYEFLLYFVSIYKFGIIIFNTFLIIIYWKLYAEPFSSYEHFKPLPFYKLALHLHRLCLLCLLPAPNRNSIWGKSIMPEIWIWAQGNT